MDFMGLITKKGLIVKKEPFSLAPAKEKGKEDATSHQVNLYKAKKKNRINQERIWYQPYTSSFVNCFNFLSRTVSSLKI